MLFYEQETRSGLAQLPEISAATEANASLMQQLLQDEATKKGKERSISTRTQMGGEISSSQEQNEYATDSSSVMSTITGGIAANHGKNGEGKETESTATSKYCSKVAEEVTLVTWLCSAIYRFLGFCINFRSSNLPRLLCRSYSH